MRHAADGERIPGNEDLLVAARADTLFACFEQFLLRGFDWQMSGPSDAQMPMPVFEVGRLVEAEMRRGRGVLLRRAELLHFVAIPDVEFSFLAFAVGIERGVVAPLARLHLAHHPARGPAISARFSFQSAATSAQRSGNAGMP